MKISRLQKRCRASINSFSSEGDVVETANGRHVFVDNGADVLVTAHLDTVATRKKCRYFSANSKGIVRSRALDDRLGVWIALDLLPQLNINVDVLLTEGEEIGWSTARDFIPTREYNWMACFDRSGDDAVTYHYYNEDAENALTDLGFDIGWGSYTDICELRWLEIWGVNIGTGYYKHHTPEAWADLKVTKKCLRQFHTFWKAFGDTPLLTCPRPYNHSDYWINDYYEVEEYELSENWKYDQPHYQDEEWSKYHG